MGIADQFPSFPYHDVLPETTRGFGDDNDLELRCHRAMMTMVLCVQNQMNPRTSSCFVPGYVDLSAICPLGINGHWCCAEGRLQGLITVGPTQTRQKKPKTTTTLIRINRIN
jgi:hypothetical protein